MEGQRIIMYENVDRGGIIIKEGVEVATKYSENIMILTCGIFMENHNSFTWTPHWQKRSTRLTPQWGTNTEVSRYNYVSFN